MKITTFLKELRLWKWSISLLESWLVTLGLMSNYDFVNKKLSLQTTWTCNLFQENYDFEKWIMTLQKTVKSHLIVP